jgi:hypothetical protein
MLPGNLRLVIAGGHSGRESVTVNRDIPAAVETATAIVHEVCEISPGGEVAATDLTWHHDPDPDGLIFRVVILKPLDATTLNRNLHASETVDIGYIISGSVTLVLPDGNETTLGANDSFVLRGGEHAWRNDADAPCAMAVVLLKPSGWLAAGS